MKKYIQMLGLPAKDKVTGLNGVLTSLNFDLYGCIQFIITPGVNKEGKCPNGHWFDVSRVKVLSETRVMEVPNFSEGYIAEGKKGAAEKPAL